MVNKITTPPTQNEVISKINELVDDKQDILISGTNIKTINNTSLLGSGNIDIQGGTDISNHKVNGAPLSNTSSHFFGISTSAATDVEKEVSIPSITELTAGVAIIVLPTITSTVANATLKLNNFTAYPIRYQNSAITTSTDAYTWTANTPSVFVFDGEYWRFVCQGYRQVYSTMSVSEGTTGKATTGRVVRADYLSQIIRGTKLTGLSTSTTGAVAEIDTVLVGMGKLQATKADKSAIPTVNNATLTIQKNGSNVATFTANASSNVTANISVPTVTSTYTATGTDAVNGVAVSNAIATKQNTLVSGTNIKTINGTSLLGSGDIVIQSAPNLDNKSITKNTANELQTVGVINQNNASLAVKTWTGTKAQYDAIVSKDSGTLYYLTDVQKIYYGNTLVCEKYNRNIGEIITSSIPLTDAGLHLLDGSLIQGGGIYDDFVQYIAGLVNTYPQCFCSEAEWQQSVNTYGVCGKFVYSNNTVRLPKITGFIEGTVDSNALGDLVEAGLPNITGNIWAGDSYGSSIFTSSSGAFQNGSNTGWRTNTIQYTVSGASDTITFDASRLSSIYGNSNTVQPQSIKVFYYIVIATTTKTNIEVDIDEIVTDLNSKANNADVVHLAGTETISGNKKFTGMTIFDRPISAGSSDLSGDVVTTKGIKKSPNGYVKLGNGLIIQWGFVSINSYNATGTTTFLTSFSSADSYSLAACGHRYAGNGQGELSISNKSNTGFSWRSTAGMNNYNDTQYWLAIGY